MTEQPNAAVMMLNHQAMKTAKGGRIGTDGRGAIALRFDDQPQIFEQKVMPLLQELGMFGGRAILGDMSPYYVQHGASWAKVRASVAAGCEVWCHSMTHGDPTPDGYEGLHREIVASKAIIEGEDIKVMGFMQPGVGQLTDQVPYGGLASIDQYDGDAGRMILNNYALSDAGLCGRIRTLPMHIYHGLGHHTMSDGEPLEDTLAIIDYVAARGLGVELLCHPNRIDDEGCLTLAQTRQVFEYIKDLWDRDEICLLTPSGLCFADAGTSQRLNLLSDSYFELPLDGASWAKTGKIAQSETGLVLSDGAGLVQSIPDLHHRLLNGEPFLLEIIAQSPDGGSLDVLIRDHNNSERLCREHSFGLRRQESRLRLPFGLHKNTRHIDITLAARGRVELYCAMAWKI